MSTTDWSRYEVDAIVSDYLSMLASELAGTPFNKSAHRRALQPLLSGRSDQSVEFKHANISAALLEAGLPYINGYKPRSNYQGLLAEVVMDRLSKTPALLAIAAADAELPMAVPEVDDILSVLTERPKPVDDAPKIEERKPTIMRSPTNYIEREARNRSLGEAGELFIINYERARLILAGKESLAAKIEHTSKVRGDYEGYDILSFDAHGAERFVEVKTTKYGSETPFFVSRNEVGTSERCATQYHVYRLFTFRQAPRLYILPGAIGSTYKLSATNFVAMPK